jgi:hypothetical protein
MNRCENSPDDDRVSALSQTGVPGELAAPPAKPNATGCAFPALVIMTYLILPVAGGLLGLITGVTSSIVLLFVPGCLAAWVGWIMADSPAQPVQILRPKWIYAGALTCWTLLIVGISATLFDLLAPRDGLGSIFVAGMFSLLVFTPLMQFVLFRIGIRTKAAWALSRRHKPSSLSRSSE